MANTSDHKTMIEALKAKSNLLFVILLCLCLCHLLFFG